MVGIEDPERDETLLRTAVQEAGRRGSRLCVVRAPAEDLRRPVEAMDFSDCQVPVDVVVEEGPPDLLLLRHAAGAALVIVGRHHRRHAVGASLGRTARAVLRGAGVPVLVVDPVVGATISSAARPLKARVSS